jgi:hypothetical protein
VLPGGLLHVGSEVFLQIQAPQKVPEDSGHLLLVLLQALGSGTSQGKGLPPEAKGEAPVVGVGEEACLPQALKGRPVGGLPLGLHLAPEIFQEDPHGFAEPAV